jgi:hypothetical protein
MEQKLKSKIKTRKPVNFLNKKLRILNSFSLPKRLIFQLSPKWASPKADALQLPFIKYEIFSISQERFAYTICEKLAQKANLSLNFYLISIIALISQ